MACTFNALTSGSGGIATTGDASGAFSFTKDGGSSEVYIDSSGNVCIGTTTAGAQQLTISSSSAETGIVLDNTSSTGRRYEIITGGSGGGFSGGAFGVWDRTAGAARMLINSSGNFQFNSGYGSVATAYGCRAWAKFTSTTTPSVSASGNITSVTYSATAQYTVAFTNAMPDANYSVVTGGNYNNAAGNFTYGTSVYSQSTTSFVIQTWAAGAAAVWNASGFVYFSVFR